MPVSLPRFIKKAFATDGLKTAIPDASNNATGRAGYDQGFPPINMQPKEAGGIPPDGTDMNGIIYDMTLAIQFVQSGVSFPFNQDFATAIGGYAVGAIVSDASDSSLLWTNGNAANTLPPSVPNGWQQFSLKQATTTVRGVSRLATQTEVNNRSSAETVVTPATLGNGFAISLGANSFIKLPLWLGGIIVQWGVSSVSDIAGTVVINVTLPTSFTVASPVVVVSDDSLQLLNYIGVRNRSSTTFQIVASEADTSIASHSFPWIAIGY